MLNKLLIIQRIFLIVFSSSIILSCSSNTEKQVEENRQPIRDIDTSTILLKINNTLFTLPSPYQATHSIKNTDIDFNRSLLNPPDNVSNYANNFKQAINLGIYGTDLGYLNIYDQIPDVISYFTVIKKLSQELGVHNALQVDLIDKIEDNILHIQNVDIIDGTPLLDIKPYIPEFDTDEDIKIGWLEKRVHKLATTKDDGLFKR